MPFTVAFVIVITVIFILDTFVLLPKGTKILTKAHLIDGDKTGYITKALKLDYSKIKKGQIWRLFSQVFLHVGFPHLIFNCTATLAVGYALETTVGTAKTALCFFFSALCSGIFMAFGMKFCDGQGASTGIYGLIAMFIFVAVKEHTVMFSSLHPVFIAYIGVYTVAGMFINRIDRLEHSSGFLGGIIFSLIVSGSI